MLNYQYATDIFRLRTRSAFVQNSEQSLGKKQQHCKLSASPINTDLVLTLLTDEKVLNAFETAMSLLRA
jgi:hypothetical protein